MNVIKKYSENRGILLKGTTTKITSKNGGFLNFLKPLTVAGLTVLKNILTPITKKALITLALLAGILAAYAAIQKKIYGSGTAAVIISKEEREDVMKIVKSLEESGLLIKGISKTIENEANEKKVDFFQCY